jgi:hypothetical protein
VLRQNFRSLVESLEWKWRLSQRRHLLRPPEATLCRPANTDRQPIEQHFPRGERGQRQGGRFSEVDPGWLAADDTLIDDLEFGVTPTKSALRARDIRSAGTQTHQEKVVAYV